MFCAFDISDAVKVPLSNQWISMSLCVHDICVNVRVVKMCVSKCSYFFSHCSHKCLCCHAMECADLLQQSLLRLLKPSLLFPNLFISNVHFASRFRFEQISALAFKPDAGSLHLTIDLSSTMKYFTVLHLKQTLFDHLKKSHADSWFQTLHDLTGDLISARYCDMATQS